MIIEHKPFDAQFDVFNERLCGESGKRRAISSLRQDIKPEICQKKKSMKEVGLTKDARTIGASGMLS